LLCWRVTVRVVLGCFAPSPRGRAGLTSSGARAFGVLLPAVPGIWDCMTNQQVVTFIRQRMGEGIPLGTICEQVRPLRGIAICMSFHADLKPPGIFPSHALNS